MADINLQSSVSRVGLNTDNLLDQVQQGWLNYALNAINGSFNGQQVSYQSEEGSVFCMSLPTGYKCIGIKNVVQISQVWYLLANPTTGNSLIGYVANGTCSFTPIIDDTVSGSDLIGFDINYPVHKIVVKTTNCSTQLYWTDRHNVRRYIDLGDLPFKTGTSAVDTNKMNVQPDFSAPHIDVEQVAIGGVLIEGDYQFAAQYADIRGNGLTSYYGVTNPVRIFLDNKVSLDYNLQTSKCIAISIDNLDTTGLYSYFNLVVIKSINQVTSAELVGTFPVQNGTYTHTYTGLEQSLTNIKIPVAEIMQQYDYYDIAGDLTQVDDVLVWADLIREEDISYQKIWNQVGVLWETWQLPTTSSQGYTNGINSALYEGYMRDEVYALEGCFILANGKQTTRCHIPGRALIPGYDDTLVSNLDVNITSGDICTPPVSAQVRWKVYNTGTLDGTDPGYSSSNDCDPQKYQFGKMGYHESTEFYPTNVDVWGPLSGTKIRHHRFPDSTITHIHNQNPNGANDDYGNYKNFIYPIGFKVDVQSLYAAIQGSTDLTNAEKRQIVGFRIMRGMRGDNASITAKGLFFNMGEYTKGGSSYYYPNYPLNDTNPDVFISSTFVPDKSGDNAQNRLNNWQQGRYTFHSPDTHFYQPSGINESFVKMETVEYGYAKCHFVQVEENAREKLRTVKALEIAIAAGLVSMFGVNVDITTGTANTVTISPTFVPQNFFPTYNNMLEILDKLTPYINYGWQYNCVGYYGNYTVVPDAGNKQRYVEFGGYITSGVNSSFGDAHPINNINRESSVYVSTINPLPFSNSVGGHVDNTRITASQAGVCHSSNPFYRSTSAYYGSIKRYLPGQYGQIFSYQAVNTGFIGKVENVAGYSDTIFGGDIFITPFALKVKHPFYNKSTVNKVDGYDIDYNQDAVSATNTGNVGYPIWYYSTDNKLLTITQSLSGQITNFTNTFSTPGGLIVAFLTAGIVPLAQALLLLVYLIGAGLLDTLGIKITNLDCPSGGVQNDDNIYEGGMAYLYAYGIPKFFVESQVNVDMRQAYNGKEGDFYPHVGGDIPDNWLQETNVSIAYDNTYTYNKTYSKENKETAFTLLRPDWAPDQQCYITYNNRAIWSDKSFLEETKNNYLVYRPANLFDFPKSFGSLVAIDRMETRAVLVRYENHTQIYNAMATIETTAIAASLGTGALFSGTQPIDFTLTDTGYMGTQNKFLLSTEQGHIFCDAKRGKVALVRGTAVEELSGSKYANSKWFSNNLPFSILNTFPTYPIDNNFNGIGLHGTYDNFYDRLILTKKDYQVIDNDLKWDGTNFYIDGGTKTITTEILVASSVTCCPPGYTKTEDGCLHSVIPGIPIFTPFIECPPTTEYVTETIPDKQVIELGDPDYFCNVSFTISFSFLSNSWISWHSYHPNYYCEFINTFQSGYNDGTPDIWDHNSTFSLFTNYRNVAYPYILEFPYSYQQLEDQQIQSMSHWCTAYLYSSFDQYTEPNEFIYFDQCVISNNQQSTGTRILVPKDLNSMRQYRQYPKYNTDSIEILVTKEGSMYNINQAWDVVKDQTLPIWLDTCEGDKVVNDENMDYGVRSYRKFAMNSKEAKVRLSLTNRHDIKLISRFNLLQGQTSYI